MFARQIARTFRLSLTTKPSHLRYFSSKKPDEQPKTPKFVKETTGLTGLPVEPDARNILIKLYKKILTEIQEIPEEAYYRREVEVINTYRLKICLENEDITEIEDKIAYGQVEELIGFANDELSLIPKMLEWKPWEVPETREIPDFFKPWEQDQKLIYETKPPSPSLVELTPEETAALKAKRPRRTRMAQQAEAAAAAAANPSNTTTSTPPQNTTEKK